MVGRRPSNDPHDRLEPLWIYLSWLRLLGILAFTNDVLSLLLLQLYSYIVQHRRFCLKAVMRGARKRSFVRKSFAHSAGQVELGLSYRDSLVNVGRTLGLTVKQVEFEGIHFRNSPLL